MKPKITEAIKRQIISEHLSEQGRKGGLVKSEKKAKASAKNGKKGGRKKCTLAK